MSKAFTKLMVQVTPVNSISERLFESKEHALIGVSPFNSYFKEEKIEQLLAWSLERFKNINVFIPDIISKFNLQAIGYLEEKAEKKTKRQDAYLKNKVIRAFEKLGFSDEEAHSKILTISKLTSNEVYMALYDKCIETFYNDPKFNVECFAASEWVFSSMGAVNLVENAFDYAVKYFLYELPLFIDTPKILNITSSLFIYHNISPAIKALYDKNNLVSSKQGWLAVEIEER